MDYVVTESYGRHKNGIKAHPVCPYLALEGHTLRLSIF